MKLNIKIIRKDVQMPLPRIIDKGDWIDLRSNLKIEFNAPEAGILHRNKGNEHREVSFDFKYIPLGICMKLPKGYEAHVLPRSSTFNKYGIICVNSQGIIDNSYCGNKDEWKFPAVALRKSTIPQFERICQFRITLSQNATVWQKIKWFFTSGIRFIEVDQLEDESRGGFGSTGNK
jgi:dUTP pyrophosphatase